MAKTIIGFIPKAKETAKAKAENKAKETAKAKAENKAKETAKAEEK